MLLRLSVARLCPWLVGLFAIAAVGAACTTTGTTRIRHPIEAGRDFPNRIEVPSGDERLLGLPAGSLTSEASLRHLDPHVVCYDAIVRSWEGADKAWTVEALFDGKTIGKADWRPHECRSSTSPEAVVRCLEPGSWTESKATDSLGMVKVFAGTFCFQHPGRLAPDSKEVALNVSQGAYTLAFRWSLTAR